MRGAALFISLASGFLASSAMAEPLTFRKLGASSTREAVLKVFPTAITKNYCKSGQRLESSSEGNTLCDKLLVEPYTLDGLNFQAGFIFAPDGRLRYVNLIKSYGRYGSEEGLVSLSEIKTDYASLQDLLLSKYGPSTRDPLQFGVGDYSGEMRWQPGRGTELQSGGDRISLNWSARESLKTPGRYRGTIQIFYTFAKVTEFDKF